MEEDLIPAFLESLRRKGKHPDTVAEYAANLREYADYLADRAVFSFFAADQEIILDYFGAAKKKRQASKTLWKKQHAVFALYEWLREEGRILLNPCPKPRIESGQRLPGTVPRWDVLRPAFERLQESGRTVDHRDLAVIDLAYSCGLRRCELHRLNLEDIRPEEGTVRVRGKGGRERIVPIGPHALKELQFYIYHVRPKLVKGGITKAVFVSWKGGGQRMNPRSMNKALRRLHRTRGLDRSITPHNLRHAFATDLVRNGAPVQDVSKMLGHAKLETTQIYTRLAPSDLKTHHGRHHPRG
jgi:integrase/recombinase XerD